MATATYITLAPITYIDDGQVKHITKAGVRVTLNSDQATSVAPYIRLITDATSLEKLPRIPTLRFVTADDFPLVGREDFLFLDGFTGILWAWSDQLHQYVTATQGSGGSSGPVTVASFSPATLITASETIAANNNDTTIPTSAAVQAAITAAVAALLDGAPEALNTLNELAAALNDDASFAAAIASALDGKQPLDSDLTTLASLTATTDSFIQSKSGAWAARTIAQVKADLGISGTNTGDQTSVTGNAGTATKLATARNINGVPFDGTANITVPSTATVVNSTASNATPALSATVNGTVITAQAAPITAFSMTGTFTAQQRHLLRIKDNGTARAITWTSSVIVAADGVTLPSTTVVGKTHTIGLIYDEVLAKLVAFYVGTN